jgi:hypothetical protein
MQQRNFSFSGQDFVYPDFIGRIIVMNTKLSDQEYGDAVVRIHHFFRCGQVNFFLNNMNQVCVVAGVFNYFYALPKNNNGFVVDGQELKYITPFMALCTAISEGASWLIFTNRSIYLRK